MSRNGLNGFGCDFSAPVYPGETIRTEIWREGQTIAFRCWSLEQEKVVINNGYLEIS